MSLALKVIIVVAVTNLVFVWYWSRLNRPCTAQPRTEDLPAQGDPGDENDCFCATEGVPHRQFVAGNSDGEIAHKLLMETLR